MKKIEDRHIVRKAEIASEYGVSVGMARLLSQGGIPTNVDALQKEYEDYILATKGKLSADQQKKFDEEINIRAPIVGSSADAMRRGLESLYPAIDEVIISNMHRAPNPNGVNQKEDIKILVVDSEGRMHIHAVSLKQYKQLKRLQVASGTYISTLCGLAFGVIGRGKFDGPHGAFVSKNKAATLSAFSTAYGPQILPDLEEIYAINDEIKEMRKNSYFPGEEVWKQFCTSTGNGAAAVFVKILKTVCAGDAAAFKQRFLDRLGLVNNHDILFTGRHKKKIYTFSTLQDSPWQKTVDTLTSSMVQLNIYRHLQGVKIQFEASGKTILEVSIPLTVNRNGAWVMDPAGRICSKDKKFYAYGQLRPLKAKEMATSTNAWMEIGPILTECLKMRPQHGKRSL